MLQLLMLMYCCIIQATFKSDAIHLLEISGPGDRIYTKCISKKLILEIKQSLELFFDYLMKVKKLEAKNVLLDMKATSTWLFISQNFPRAIDQNIDSLLLGINAKD